MKLNREAYRMEKDNLIYDLSHPIDATNITFTIPEDGTGIVKRGQLIDYSEDGYVLHAEDGVVSAIVAEDNTYDEDDTEITLSVYISGTFTKSACISDIELTDADIENFRMRGIYLK